MNKRTTLTRKTGSGKSGGSFRGFIGKLVIVFLILLALPLGYLGAKVYQQMKDMPDIAVLEKYEPIEAIQIFDKNDKLVCTVEGDEDRRVVPLSQISTQMQQAMLGAEDHHFYEHHGINPASIVRAFFTNLQAGHVVEGGSTITQQLIKNLFFEDKGRTFDRKIKEALMSYEIERRYPKDRILEMYLNQVYFGNGGYGIERAAQRYFATSAASLDLAQSAFLAGLVKAPSELGNPSNREPAIARQHEILDRMVEFGYVTPQQAEHAKNEKLAFKKSVNPLQRFPFYVSYVLEQLRGRFSEAEMRRQGLRVYTNLDPAVQDLAEKILNADIKKAPKGVSQSALVCVSVKDGSVMALVGGVGDFWKNQFNRATNPHTAGSSFKPFVYLTAFLKNIFRPDSFIDDTPITIKQGWGLPDWTPHNYDHKFLGRITIRKALSQSRNVPAVKVGKAAGIDSVVETARLAGITSKLDPNLSLSLGSSAVTPLDMAGAYGTFARGGVAIKPQVIRRIEDNRGKVIETFEPKVDKVFDSDAVARLVEVLQEVVKSGTGVAAALPDRPVAGKTGTADQGKDIWFVGFTPDTVCALWGGNDENLPIPGHNVTGGGVMAKIWKDFMQAYYLGHPTAPGAFVEPSKQIEESPLPETATDQNGVQMPKLVPLQSEAVNGGEEVVPHSPDPTPAPAMESPYATAPQGAPVPSSQVPVAPPIAPQSAMPPLAPALGVRSFPGVPVGQLAVPRASSYTSGSSLTAPGQDAIRSTGNDASSAAPAQRRTFINSDGTRTPSYNPVPDAQLTPGLGKRRFIPAGGVNSQAN